jgi:tryptophan halogenase
MALQTDRNINRITIVGGGTSGYLTVLYFCRKRPDIHITWIYPQDNKPIGVGEATVPDVTNFLTELGININDILNDINGSLKIGARFEGWADTGQYFYHPFGLTDQESLEIEWMMQNDKLDPNILDNYSDLAVNFDVRELASWLDIKFKEFSNLTIIRKSITDADEVEDDHIVDCTGFAKVLINKGQIDNFKSIKHIIPNNRAFVYRAQYSDIDKQQVAYTTLTAANYGWIWNTPLKNVVTFGYIHDDKFDVKQEFIDFVENKVGYKIDQSKIGNVPMITGRNINHIRRQGDKTIYSIGLSSFFIEPLEATGLYLTSFGIKLLDKLIHKEITEDYYNSEYNREFDAVTDFIVAYYRFSNKKNEYWDSFKQLEINKHRKNFIFPERSWHYILSGLGEEPRQLTIEAKSILKIRKGITYREWLKNEGHIT